MNPTSPLLTLFFKMMSCNRNKVMLKKKYSFAPHFWDLISDQLRTSILRSAAYIIKQISIWIFFGRLLHLSTFIAWLYKFIIICVEFDINVNLNFSKIFVLAVGPNCRTNWVALYSKASRLYNKANICMKFFW